MKAVGSYGRSTGTKGWVTEEDDPSRPRGSRAEARGLAGTGSRNGRSATPMESAVSMETMDTEDEGPYARRSKHHHKKDQAQGACRQLPLRGSRDKSQRNHHRSKEEEQ
ncbi:uncharacterized protein UDID_18162 [Ustilago sp. UG-2017a]|nr:uncharacterized protein UDID_18162 [Ustilago sp. UG-2017a]